VRVCCLIANVLALEEKGDFYVKKEEQVNRIAPTDEQEEEERRQREDSLWKLEQQKLIAGIANKEEREIALRKYQEELRRRALAERKRREERKQAELEKKRQEEKQYIKGEKEFVQGETQVAEITAVQEEISIPEPIPILVKVQQGITPNLLIVMEEFVPDPQQGEHGLLTIRSDLLKTFVSDPTMVVYGVDRTKLEVCPLSLSLSLLFSFSFSRINVAQTYLDFDEFDSVMQMSAQEYYAMPKWKQQKHKTKIGLF
jgi:hypothetical protein